MTESATAKSTSNPYTIKLEHELNRMINAQFESPEFRLLADTPLTMVRARYYAVQLVFYAFNRRDCWAYVQARAAAPITSR
jgi:hypothetical protein